uniref:Uncharacterized protein n=1 Tax=Bos indicus x Bos taurus TaxID=30522 RepID=A0A4W2GK06_BOBOX
MNGLSHSAVPLCQGCPHHVPAHRRGSGEDRPSVHYHRRLPSPPAPRSRKRVRKGFGLLTATGEWRSARRGAQLPSGDPRVHHGAPCPGGGVLLLQEIQRSRRSGGWWAEEPAARLGTRPAGERGVPRGAPGRGGSRESYLGGARGGAPGRSRPGAAGPGLGVCERPGSQAGTQWPRRGRPFWGGVSAGDGGRSRDGQMARCWKVLTGTARPLFAVSVSRGDLRRALGRGRARLRADPGARRSQSHALRASGSVQDWQAQQLRGCSAPWWALLSVHKQPRLGCG